MKFFAARNWLLFASTLRKKPVRVAFQLVHASVWKLDGLYRLLDESERFEPFVVICPVFRASLVQQEKEYALAKDLCRREGYRYYETVKSGVELSLKQLGMGRPDVVFIQNSWEPTKKRYRSGAWHGSLVCYVPYFVTMNTLGTANYGSLFHKKLWKYFLESELHAGDAVVHRQRHDQHNLVITGHPGLDPFLFPRANIVSTDPWRDAEAYGERRVRVIYAPHHTISGADSGLAYSTFENFGDWILQLAEENSDRYHFAFKPHPLLFDKLINHVAWGRLRTEAYWKKWSEITNAQIEEGEYSSLFLHSDALIHDSNSFMAEYLATGKPVMLLLNGGQPGDKLNAFGRKMLAGHYLGRSRQNIVDFLGGLRPGDTNSSDPLARRRHQLIEDLLIGPRNVSAAEAIFQHLELQFSRGGKRV